jgi:hypothetical protein
MSNLDFIYLVIEYSAFLRYKLYFQQTDINLRKLHYCLLFHKKKRHLKEGTNLEKIERRLKLEYGMNIDLKRRHRFEMNELRKFNIRKANDFKDLYRKEDIKLKKLYIRSLLNEMSILKLKLINEMYIKKYEATAK